MLKPLVNALLLIPLWLILLWSLLATTLNHCLAWSAEHWWRAAFANEFAPTDQRRTRIL